MAADARGRLWNSLRGSLPAGCHATRIENEMTGEHAGFPDVHYTYLEVSGTIELKSVDRLPMKKAGLRKAQINWMKEEVEAGGLVWVLIQFKKDFYVVNGLYAETMNDWNEDQIRQFSAAQWSVKAYDPDILHRILRNTG